MSIGLYRSYSLLLIYGIKKLKLVWDLHQKKQVGLRLERFDPEYSPLIPDPLRWHVNKCLCNKRKVGMDLGSVIIDCGDKHYNKGITPGYLYVMQWEAS